jgi:hypothetical protein
MWGSPVSGPKSRLAWPAVRRPGGEGVNPESDESEDMEESHS